MIRIFTAIAFSISFFSGFAQYYDPGSGIDKLVTEEKGHYTKSPKAVAADDGVDVHHVEASWSITPTERYISGRVRHSLKVKQARNSIDFDLYRTMEITSVKVNGAAVSFSRSGDKISVPGNFLTGFNYTVEFIYSGEPPLRRDEDGFGSFTIATHSGTPIIWTLSEPYGALDWWPCRQNLNDKIDSIDIYIETPPGQVAASNGLLVETDSLGFPFDRLRYHYKHRYPIATYLVAIAVTNYVFHGKTLDLPSGPLLVQNLIYPEDLESPTNVRDLDQLYRFLAMYDSLYTAYPFNKEKYGMAHFGWGGGMEHQTMSFMGNFQYELTAHELAHQWFGDKITCGDWSNIWLNEGFATYSAAMAYNIDSPDLYWQRWKELSMNLVRKQPGGTVFVPSGANVSRIFDSRLTYYKGALVLHMLRWTVGNDVFFRTLRTYLNKPNLQYGFALTDQLRAEFEKSSGRDLKGFFDQWIYKEGFPTYQVQWSNSGGKVEAVIRQTTSHPSVSFFRMDLPLRFKNADHDTIIRAKSDFNGQRYTFLLNFTPDSLIVDPDRWLLMGPAAVFRGEPGSDPQPVLYPNPSKDFLNLWLPGNTGFSETVEVFDQLGRKVDARVLSVQEHMIRLDINNLSEGAYTITLRNAGREEKIRFVKSPGE
ncbi:MAG: M1 family aminopeptidase [Bacteroidota bacterium]